MPANDYRDALAVYIRAQARPADKYSHQPRLYRLAQVVGEGQQYDDDVLYAAALLHDLGVFMGHRPEDIEALSRWDHVAYAMAKAPELLIAFGFPADKVPAVLSAIRTHLPNTQPDCIEGWILRDADLLEQLGAVGILRIASKVGRDTRYPTLGPVLETLRRSLNSLPNLLHFERSRELARERQHVMAEFLDAAERESQGLAW